jgi:hypothetical protein
MASLPLINIFFVFIYYKAISLQASVVSCPSRAPLGGAESCLPAGRADSYFSHISIQQSGQTRKQKPHPLQEDVFLTLAYFIPFLFRSCDKTRFFEGQKKIQS